MLAPTDPVAPMDLPLWMLHLARVHESFSTFITARLPPRAIDVAGGTRSRAVGKALWRTLYVMWVGEHSQAITNDEERRMFLRYSTAFFRAALSHLFFEKNWPKLA